MFFKRRGTKVVARRASFQITYFSEAPCVPSPAIPLSVGEGSCGGSRVRDSEAVLWFYLERNASRYIRWHGEHAEYVAFFHDREQHCRCDFVVRKRDGKHESRGRRRGHEFD